MEKEPHICQRYKILVVDDDIVFLRTAMNYLNEEYRVSVVKSGLEALAYMSKEKPDAILLDYEMPDFDGPQTLKMIRTNEELKNVPVFFMTGVNDPELVKKALELKPQGYILKTTSKNELLDRLAEFFNALS
ncbi:MAG: response regulator [Treponema sp.]|uniref:response regulator n=1 Tax=Treponema sp. TaxID=166 RepID=UPI00298DA193|nr:response regulator [Treponema sp.]MCQ2599883.1 response regulator [Treponema sp.]